LIYHKKKHTLKHWIAVDRMTKWVIAILERAESVKAFLTAIPEVKKLPLIIWLELTPVSHLTPLGTIMMGRETEAHLLQVR
jgi:hypothetical protein